MSLYSSDLDLHLHLDLTHIQNDTPRLLHHSVQTKVESGFKTSAQHVTQLHPVSPPSS